MGKKIRNSRKRNAEKTDDITESLNERQKLFCNLYISDKECFGNASKAYRTAYGMSPAQYRSANVNAHRLLTNANIRAYINKTLDESFNNESVDRELSKIIAQDKDLVSKGMMIKEFNKLKQRITDKSEVIHKFPKPILDHVRSDNSNTKGSILTKAN